MIGAIGLSTLAPVPWPVTPAMGATFTVTKTTDTNDGTCNADCSLREAIVAANATNDGGTVKITDSTISDNSADDDAGGIFNFGTVKASFVTIADNSAVGQGGGIFRNGGTVNIRNSIVADNTAGGSGPNCSGGVTASGANLATDASCAGFAQVTSAQLNLGPLTNYGDPRKRTPCSLAV